MHKILVIHNPLYKELSPEYSYTFVQIFALKMLNKWQVRGICADNTIEWTLSIIAQQVMLQPAMQAPICAQVWVLAILYPIHFPLVFLEKSAENCSSPSACEHPGLTPAWLNSSCYSYSGEGTSRLKFSTSISPFPWNTKNKSQKTKTLALNTPVLSV